jgi:hypothetical protein
MEELAVERRRRLKRKEGGCCSGNKYKMERISLELA